MHEHVAELDAVGMQCTLLEVALLALDARESRSDTRDSCAALLSGALEPHA